MSDRGFTYSVIYEAVNDEVASLVDDLNEAYRARIWSMGCEAKLQRIGALVDVGARLPDLCETAMSRQLFDEMVRKLESGALTEENNDD